MIALLQSSRMKKSPLRVVIVGGGFFGSKRLQACLELSETFQVMAVIDPSEQQRFHVMNTYHIPAVESFSMLSKPAELAIIATPNIFHAEASIEAMKRGMHVLCEKPLATRVNDAERIVRAAKRYKKIVKTGSNHRFFHTIQKAKELYDKGSIGTLLNFKGSIGTNGSRVSRKWFWNKEWAGGGTFIDNGCHLIDLARMFLGDFTSVTASMETNLWKKAGVEDMGTAIFRTKDGRLATISSSWYQWAGYLHIELWGEKGYIIVDSTTHDTVTIGGVDGEVVTYDYSHEKKDSYQRELLYLESCIRKHAVPSPNASDGAAIIALIDAAYISSRDKTWKKI